MSTGLHQNAAKGSLRDLCSNHLVGFLAAAAVVLLAGLYLSLYHVPNTYSAEAVLVVSAPAPGAATEVTGDAVLTSAAHGMGLAEDASPSAVHAQTAHLRSLLTVGASAGVSDRSEVRIIARGADPGELARAANAAAEAWIALREKNSAEQRAAAEAWRAELAVLESSAAAAQTTLAGTKSDLAAFEGAHANVFGAGRTPDASLAALLDEQKKLTQDLETAQDEVTGLEAAGELLLARLKNVPEFIEQKEVTTVPDPGRQSLQREIEMMERQLQEMLQTYTIKHPDVVELQMNLLMKKQELKKHTGRMEGAIRETKERNPEYANLKTRLDDTIVKLQLARTTLNRLQEKPEVLKKQIEELRGVIAQHGALKESVAKTWKALEEARAPLDARKADAAAAPKEPEPVPQLTVRAQAPALPIGPDRTLYLVGTALLALLAGALSMAASTRLGRGFASRRELQKAVDFPVLAEIGAVAGTDAERRERSRRRARLAASLAIACVTALGIIVMALGTA